MSDVTINQLSTLLNLPADKLLEQLAEAGMKFDSPDQVVSSTEKLKLLGFLRRTHGKGSVGSVDETAPRQVTLKRRKVSELKVSAGTGPGRAGATKTVAVEVRARRTYVKRSVITAESELDQDREKAQRKLDESLAERAREEAERAAVVRKRQEEEAAKLHAEEVARERVEQERLEVERRAEAEAMAKQAEAESNIPVVDTPQVPVALPPEVGESPRKVAKQAEKQPSQKRHTRHGNTSEAPKDSKSRHHRGAERGSRRSAEAAGRFATGQLHLTAEERARRGAGRKKGRRSADLDKLSAQHGFSKPIVPVVREVRIGEAIAVSELAQKMAIKGADVVKALFKMGVMATINEVVDHDTAVLVVQEMGHKPIHGNEETMEQKLVDRIDLGSGEEQSRPPVVTIMGHVDHGKTSLLDHIRQTRVTAGESGGITQHIGAYYVETSKGVITFLDTPGHAAFSSMRARGAKVTDIVVLVVAADDGVKPQTIEAIQHARAADVPLVVAVNKIDKPEANMDNVKQGLVQQEVVPEDWGGDVQFIPVSAKTGEGIDDLLGAISMQAELMELKAVVEAHASGTVVESSLDKGRGPVATILVQRGLLKKGDFMVCGIEFGRVRALFDAAGKQIVEAGPSIPVQVLGLSGVPEAGDDFVVVADERLAKNVASERDTARRESRLVRQANRLEDIMARMGQGEGQQVLNILIKAGVQGSVEALREALGSIGNEQVKVNVIASGVGGITESDATLAVATNALVIGFNVRADASARKVIDANGLDVRYFSIIYEVIDQVTQAASGLLSMEIREEIIGTAEVRDVFRSSKFGSVAGCMVVEGIIKRHKPIRVLRDNTVIFEGELESLRRFKELVVEVRSNMECGVAVKQYNDVRPGDKIECFERTEVARSL